MKSTVRVASISLVAALLVAAACNAPSAPSADTSSSQGGATSGATSTSTGPADPCEGIPLPPCPTPCPADFATTLCGTPCFFSVDGCGDALGRGMACEDGTWTCTQKEAPGRFVGCDLVCRSLCSPMSAKGEDQCGAFIGYRWNGQACEGVDCSCVGSDCGSLFADAQSCEAAHQSCHADQPNACASLSCGSSCGEGCVDPECQLGVLSCDAQGACTTLQPICAPPPCPPECAPPPPTCTACDFGGVVCPEVMLICVFGNCVFSQSDCGPPEPD